VRLDYSEVFQKWLLAAVYVDEVEDEDKDEDEEHLHVQPNTLQQSSSKAERHTYWALLGVEEWEEMMAICE